MFQRSPRLSFVSHLRYSDHMIWGFQIVGMSSPLPLGRQTLLIRIVAFNAVAIQMKLVVPAVA